MTFLGSTVGRICDHIDTTSSFVIDHLGMLILDEADRLLDLGFEKKLRWIVTRIKERKQEHAELEEFKKDVDTEAIDEYGSEEDNLNKAIGYMGPGTIEHRRELIGTLERQNASKRRMPNALCDGKNEGVKSHQSVLLSATLTRSVIRLADFVLNRDAEWVAINSQGERILNKERNVDSSSDTAMEIIGDSECKSVDEERLRGGLSGTSGAALTIPSHLKQSYVDISLKTRFITLMSFILDKAKTGKV